MLLVAVTAGLLGGAGVVAVVYGLRPPLARLDHQIDAVLGGVDASAGACQRWRDWLVARTPPGVLPDLAMLGRTTAEFVTARLAWAAAGLVMVATIAAVTLPAWLVPVVALAGAAAGWFIALHEVRDAADKRRRTLGLALAAFTQMAAMLIRAGMGIDQAMTTAAHAGTHWTFDLLASAMRRAAGQRQPIWQGLEQLGTDTDVAELRQLAAELRLTDTVGGSPADALFTRARVLRDEELATQMSAAKAAEVKTAVPLVVLGLCLTAFVVYPAVETFLGV